MNYVNSTVSSGLNSLAAITLEDFVRPFMFKSMSERRATLVSRLLTFMYGLISFGLVFVAEQLGDILQVSRLHSFVSISSAYLINDRFYFRPL
jgi:Na+/proline symporter